MKPPIMIMGIMASGKSQICQQIATDLGGVFIEGDDWHPQSNVDKMQAGIALSDTDRMPWLDRLAAEVDRAARQRRQVVFSCSALKRAYRDRLRAALPELIVICLTLDAETAARRSSERSEHFMPTALVGSQLATLELPVGEARTALVNAKGPFEQVVEQTAQAVQRLERANAD